MLEGGKEKKKVLVKERFHQQENWMKKIKEPQQSPME